MKKIIITFLMSCLALMAGCGDSSTDSNGGPTLQTEIIRVPRDAPTIQAGIDASDAYDTVLVADGIYAGSGNRKLVFSGKIVTLMSENGPATTIIDCGGSAASPNNAFIFLTGEDKIIVEGFTVRGGYSTQGGAVFCESASPTFINCVFTENGATISGGALWCKSSSLKLINCTFDGNSSPAGAAMFISAGSHPQLQNCVISNSRGGDAIETLTMTGLPILTCCLMYGNEGGDWAGTIADQAGQNGNFSANPRYCDAESGNHNVHSDSPCLPENNSCGEQIGALGQGCL